jgi:hypothetical protein
MAKHVIGAGALYLVYEVTSTAAVFALAVFGIDHTYLF